MDHHNDPVNILENKRAKFLGINKCANYMALSKRM